MKRKTLVLVLVVGVALAGAGGHATALERRGACASDAALEAHMLILIEATEALDGAGPGSTPTDALVDRFYARAILEAERLTAAGAKLPEPWTAAPFAPARRVAKVVAARGLDPDLAETFLAAARRLAED